MATLRLSFSKVRYSLNVRMVDTYHKCLMDKLDLHTLAVVVRYAVRTGTAPD